MLTETNEVLGLTYTYTYDNAGNIKTITTKNNSTGYTYTQTLTYRSSGWGDRLAYIQLNEYDTMSFSYDALGNISHYSSTYPYEDVYLTWEGRQLLSFFPDNNGGYDFYFSYDDEGRRISKGTEGQIYTNYVYEGDLLLYETGTYGTIVYIYDGGSTPIGMMYRASSETATWQTFWYEKNLQGDVVAVYDNNGVKQVSYVYDAWGNFTTTTHVSGTAATYNPIRYRSYYYDREINLYYLGARWYSARFHRFMSPDDVSYLGANGNLNSYNLYAYCSNNPVMFTDPTGHSMVLAVLGIGLLIGLIGTAIADYADDGEVFNGSIDALSYAQNASVVALGGLLVYAALPYIGSFLSSSFAIPTIAGTGSVAVTVTGAQVAMGVTIGAIIHAATTENRNGYWGQKYSDDHAPDHIHLKGPNTDIRIGRDGNPLKGERSLNAQQRKALRKLWESFLKLFNS